MQEEHERSDDNEYSEDYSPKPPGMSSGIKILLISLAVLGVLVVACCGGGLWWIQNNVGVKESREPAVIRQTQEDIIDLEIPPRFEPLQSLSVNFMVFSVEMAMFEASGEELSELGVMRIKFDMDDMSREDAERQMAQENMGTSQLDESESETREYTVDGKEIPVTIAHGKLQQSETAPASQIGKDWYTATATIATSDGIVKIGVAGPEEEFDEEEIETLIQSIRLPAEE